MTLAKAAARHCLDASTACALLVGRGDRVV